MHRDRKQAVAVRDLEEQRMSDCLMGTRVFFWSNEDILVDIGDSFPAL